MVRNAKCKMDIQRKKPRSSYEITDKSTGVRAGKARCHRNPSREGIHPRSQTDIPVGRIAEPERGPGRGTGLPSLRLPPSLGSPRSVCNGELQEEGEQRRAREGDSQRGKATRHRISSGWKWPLPGRGSMQGEGRSWSAGTARLVTGLPKLRQTKLVPSPPFPPSFCCRTPC